MPVERHERTVQLRATIPEYTPGGTVVANRAEIKGGGEDGFVGAVRLLDDPAGVIRDERRAVVGDGPALALLRADPVRRHQRHDVRSGMTLHRTLPMIAGVDARILRLGPDGGW